MTLPPEETPPSSGAGAVPWRGWEALLIYLLSLLVAAPVIFIGTLALTKNGSIAFAAAATELILLATVVVWVRARYGLGIEALGWRTDDVRGDLLAGLGAGIAGLALQFALLPPLLFLAREILNRDVSPPDQLPVDKPGVGLLIVLGIAVTVIAPVAEELFFRGFLFQAFQKWMGLGAAAGWSAVAFGLAHVSPLLYLPIGVLGYLLARTMERRKSIIASIVGHAVFNVFGFVVIVVSLD